MRFVAEVPSHAVLVGAATFEVRTVGARVTQFSLRAPENRQVRLAWSNVQGATSIAVPHDAETIYAVAVEDVHGVPYTCKAVLTFFYLPVLMSR
jgi:hypothetical protein